MCNFGGPTNLERDITVDYPLEEDIEGEIRTSALYDNYRHWCGANGFFAESNRNFINELRKMGTIERRRPKTGGEKTTLLLGYKLKNEFEDFLA